MNFYGLCRIRRDIDWAGRVGDIYRRKSTKGGISREIGSPKCEGWLANWQACNLYTPIYKDLRYHASDDQEQPERMSCPFRAFSVLLCCSPYFLGAFFYCSFLLPGRTLFRLKKARQS